MIDESWVRIRNLLLHSKEGCTVNNQTCMPKQHLRYLNMA